MDEYIEIKGARVNNLKNVSLKIPRNKLVVIAECRAQESRLWPSTHSMLKDNEDM